jgi:excisionase family DNA binding protein
MPTPEMMSTREVAAYLRIKERKVYDLIRTGGIPCSRVTGKWLFPKPLIDLWVAQGVEGRVAIAATPPPVAAGSHDPLLEWALGESRSELALLPGGSLDGLRRLAAGKALVAGLHVLDPDSGAYNVPLIEQELAGTPVVAIHWAVRRQGLVVAAGNPLNIRAIADLEARDARVVQRQDEAGSQILLRHLLAGAGVDAAKLALLPQPARGEMDLALAVSEGKADAGLAIETVAHQLGLDFVPLRDERYDLVMARRDYFEPSIQRLLTFTRTAAFQTRAAELAGYDVSALGEVAYNGP